MISIGLLGCVPSKYSVQFSWLIINLTTENGFNLMNQGQTSTKHKTKKITFQIVQILIET